MAGFTCSSFFLKAFVAGNVHLSITRSVYSRGGLFPTDMHHLILNREITKYQKIPLISFQFSFCLHEKQSLLSPSIPRLCAVSVIVTVEHCGRNAHICTASPQTRIVIVNAHIQDTEQCQRPWCQYVYCSMKLCYFSSLSCKFIVKVLQSLTLFCLPCILLYGSVHPKHPLIASKVF